MEMNHEDIYRQTIRKALRAIEDHAFTETATPKILAQLRMELGQCIELLLISPEFYQEQMELLQREVMWVNGG